MSDKTMGRVGVGMPEWLWLNLFGKLVNDCFGSYPYLVGSAARSKEWRDVDVRLILADDEYERTIGPFQKPEELSRRWQVLNMAFSALAQRMTGLPVDFQIQQMTDTNKQYDGPRHALIIADLGDDE
jgi:hypothetical protein